MYIVLGSDYPKLNRKGKERSKAQITFVCVCTRARVCERERESKQVNKKVNGQKSSPPSPRALFIGRRMVVVYIYSIDGVKYYKKVLRIYNNRVHRPYIQTSVCYN